MSTHSTLGIKYPDGSIDGCYVHYDGATMEERIHRYLRTYSTTCLALLITQAQVGGGMRSFHCASWPETSPPVTELFDDNESYVISEHDFYEDHMGTYAWYLIDFETGTLQITHSHVEGS